MGKFVIRAVPTGTKFDLRAANGEVILTSEVYSSKASCKSGIKSVRRNAGVPVEDQTVEGFARVKHPKYVVYLDRGGEFRFRLLASNGQNIGASEGYRSKASCMNGIESVKKNAPDAEVTLSE